MKNLLWYYFDHEEVFDSGFIEPDVYDIEHFIPLIKPKFIEPFSDPKTQLRLSELGVFRIGVELTDQYIQWDIFKQSHVMDRPSYNHFERFVNYHWELFISVEKIPKTLWKIAEEYYDFEWSEVDIDTEHLKSEIK